MDIAELVTYIDAAEKNASLYEEKNLDARIEVTDFLGFHIMGQPETGLQKAAICSLNGRAEKIITQLEAVDNSLFQKLRANIRAGKYSGTAFKNMLHEYVDFSTAANTSTTQPGYDNLDIFINGLFSFQPMPEQTKDLEPGMICYHKTPARIVLEMAEQLHFSSEDIFFDLGAGLGQVAILINLLTGVTVKGVEFETAFCSYANECAAQLHLGNTTFIDADARNADYSGGTIFFMFTPFIGKMLEEVLALLKASSLQRKITVITYGPCTAQVIAQTWLTMITEKNEALYKLVVFKSV